MNQRLYRLMACCLFLQQSLYGLQTAKSFISQFTPSIFSKEQDINAAKKTVLISLLQLYDAYLGSLKSGDEEFFYNQIKATINKKSLNELSSSEIQNYITRIKDSLAIIIDKTVSGKPFVTYSKTIVEILNHLYTLNIKSLCSAIKQLVSDLKTTHKKACEDLLTSTIALINTINENIKNEKSSLHALSIELKTAVKKPKSSTSLIQQIKDFAQSKWVLGLLTAYVTSSTISSGFEQAAYLATTQPSLYRTVEIPLLGSFYFADIQGKASLLTPQTIANVFFDNFWTNLFIISSPYSLPYIYRGIWGCLGFLKSAPPKKQSGTKPATNPDNTLP